MNQVNAVKRSGRPEAYFSLGDYTFIFAVVAIIMIGIIGCVGSTRQPAGSTATTSLDSSTAQSAGAVLSASNSSLDFGNVQVGTSATRQLGLTNTGHSNLTISTTLVTGSEFGTSDGSTITLIPNRSTQIYVSFVPTAAGSANGIVSIASDATNAMVQISISGVGVTPKATTNVGASPDPAGIFDGKGNFNGTAYVNAAKALRHGSA